MRWNHKACLVNPRGGGKSKQKTWKKQKTSNKLVDFNSTISIIICK